MTDAEERISYIKELEDTIKVKEEELKNTTNKTTRFLISGELSLLENFLCFFRTEEKSND